MGNEVAVRGGTSVVSADDFYAALAAEAQTYRGGGGGVSFLKFNGNDGYYSYGADDIDLALATQVAANMKSVKRGWICWVGGQVKEEIMLGIMEGQPPIRGALPDYGPYGKDDGWSEQKTIEFTTIDGETIVLLFQANNKSKMNALEALIKDFSRKFKDNPGMIPIIELGENEFETQPKNEDGSKGRKVRKHAPNFTIVGWMSEEELLSLSEGAAEDYPEEGAEGGEVAGDYDQVEGEEPPAEEVAEEPAPEPAPRGGRRPAPAAAAPATRAPASRPAAAAAPAARTAAPAATARPAPARPAPAAPAAVGAPRGRRF